MFKLVIQDDEGKTTVVPLIRDEITVGRKEGNTIRLTERNVSRRHARFMRANGSVAIEDLNSYNGVRVNGSRIQGRVGLSASDRIQIGDYLIELKAEDAERGDGEPFDQKTQPIERVDPMAAGAVPDNGVPSSVVSISEATTVPAQPSYPSAAALADTDPGAGAVNAPAQTPARLVILSNNFPGREFEILKPAMVIGRTDDNDIVINHRSISRHHAKIVRENGRFAIVDLQSSNGVRVNGEDYGKVELRRGDVVDLGHVRMRFVEPNEDFVFGRDAQPVDVSTGGGGRGLVMALVALILVGGGVGAYLLTRGGDSQAGMAASGDSPAEAGEPAVVAPVGASFDAGATQAAVEPPQVQESDELKAALEAARQAVQDERWDEAAKHATAALSLDGDSASARALAEQAANEKDNKGHFDRFQKAVKKKDFATVAEAFAKIDHGSVYRDRAIDDHDRLRDEYVGDVRKQAERWSTRGRCDEVRKLEGRARRVWIEAADIAAVIAKACEERKVATDGGGTSRTGPNRTGPTNTNTDDRTDGGGTSGTGTNGGAPAGGKTAQELKEESVAAAKAGQYGRALRLCEQALVAPGLDRSSRNEVLSSCVVAACNLKNEAKAKKYWRQLPTDRQTMGRSHCLRQGIEVLE